MNQISPAADAEQLTRLILQIFRANGRLLEAGNHLVAPFGLTSPRWQVLGAIDGAASPMPVAHIARTMGLVRQGVQRLVNEMAGDGLLEFAPNPYHERAKLVLMTAKGQQVYAEAMAVQQAWAAQLAAVLDADQVAAAGATLQALCALLEEHA